MNATLDAVAGRRAARQIGLLSRADALRIGFTARQIDVRIASGRWRRVGPSTYAVSGAPPGWQQDALGACLASRQSACTSHLTAAALWGLCPAPTLPHVIVPPGTGNGLPVARVHRMVLADEDRTTIGPVPVTRLARTLVDCAAVASGELLRNIVDSALDTDRVRPADIAATFDRMGRAIRGRRALIEALEPWTAPIAPDSPAEARLVRRLRQWNFPEPQRQFQVVDELGRDVGRVDVAWPSCLCGLEYDGGPWHGPRRIERDEARHQELTRLGWAIVHVDRLDLRPGDDRLKREIADVLRTRSAA